MDNEFAELKSEILRIKKAMYDNLIKRNNGSNVFSDRLVIDENSFTIDELYDADGILNRQKASQKMEDASDTARKSALEKNKYSPDNPYPPKGKWQ